MPSFSKTLGVLISILSDIIHRNDTLGTFCSRITIVEHFHPRFYPVLKECHSLLDKKIIHFEKKNEINNLCTCGEEDCDCTWDFY